MGQKWNISSLHLCHILLYLDLSRGKNKSSWIHLICADNTEAASKEDGDTVFTAALICLGFFPEDFSGLTF